MDNEQNDQPKGIGFYSVKTGETRHAVLDAQIQGYINSSDLGINASRGQDYGWRLSAPWVKKVRAFRADENRMATLSAKLRLEDDQLPSLTQILYAIYGQQLRAAQTRAQEKENPFEQEYLSAIGDNQAPQVDPLDRYEEDGSANEEIVEQTAPAPEPASEQIPHVPADSPDKPSMPTAPAVEASVPTKPKAKKKEQ